MTQGIKHCGNCGTAVSAGMLRCGKCGVHPMSALTHCTNCGAGMSEKSTKCLQCGKVFELGQVTPEVKQKTPLIPSKRWVVGGAAVIVVTLLALVAGYGWVVSPIGVVVVLIGFRELINAAFQKNSVRLGLLLCVAGGLLALLGELVA